MQEFRSQIQSWERREEQVGEGVDGGVVKAFTLKSSEAIKVLKSVPQNLIFDVRAALHEDANQDIIDVLPGTAQLDGFCYFNAPNNRAFLSQKVL
ncbi:hypothetical protein PoB_000766300 [Plakobranchus ocellatus]|uniref:Uncharacterized protein n=1 Tax=Plakobranchus ocellatus TaxID=259542 RepID=A0AAV3YG92_9GAST|nr:hypothetical protein PoB_000766300 [Plakobranchus ocellatus]